MHRLRFSLFPLFLLSLFTVGELSAQGLVEPEGGVASVPLPDSHLLDEAGLFRGDPEKKAAIEAHLTEIESKHGYVVYLATYYNIFNSNPQLKAEDLYQQWIGDDVPGAVIVYQSDPLGGNLRNPGIAYFRDTEGAMDQQRIHIPVGDMDMLMQRVMDGLEFPGEQREEKIGFLQKISERLEKEFTAYYAVEPQKWSDSENLKLMAIFASVVTGLALLGMLLWSLFTKKSKHRAKRYFFPEVHVGRRLGASFGGGHISERSFPSSSSRE